MSDRPLASDTNPSAHLGAAELKHLIRVVRREWRWSAVGLAVCLTAAAIYLVRTPRMYQATARVLVLETGRQPLKVTEADAGGGEGGVDRFPTYAAILSSPHIVGRAIEQVGVENLPTLQLAKREGKTPTQAAIEELDVSRPDRAASVLRIDYRARTKEEAVLLTDALIRSFEAFLEESYQSNNTKVVTLITEARDLISKELVDLEQKYLEIRKKNTVLATDQSGRSFITRRVDGWDSVINQTLVRAVELRTQLELGKSLREKGVGLAGIAYALGQFRGDPGESLAISSSAGRSQALASDYVRQLINEQQRLADRFGADYSRVRDIEEQIARVQQVAADSRRSVESVEVDDLILSIEQAVASVEALQQEYTDRFREDLEQARQILNDQAEEENIRAQLDRQQRLFNTVVDQLKQAQLVGEYSGVVTQTIEPPHALRKAVRPRVLLTLCMALMSGLVLGTMAALAADGLDSRVRSLDEVRSMLGSRILGVIPRLSKAELAETTEPGLVVHQRPGSLTAEAYRALRTGLEFVRRERDVRVIVVCSPSPGDGKSTVTSNLAIGLAQAGRRVLLIDCDLRKPSQDRIHGIDRAPGLSEVLRGISTWREVLQPSAAEDLRIMTTGGPVENPAELLMSERFRSLVAELRGEFDRVLIDTSPLLYVADPSIVAPSADGVLLVLRPSEIRRAAMHRVAEVVQMMGTPLLGSVVNADGSDDAQFLHAGRYYGRYGRSYGSVDGSGPRTGSVWPSGTAAGEGASASWAPASLLRRLRTGGPGPGFGNGGRGVNGNGKLG
ncbi:polysaccharide biosynthesis tyrosine autokinase [Tautonia sociabilis]|nr:polysaccharide biosynthesis tyrosine autokinase [Tautonia sociabilis]